MKFSLVFLVGVLFSLSGVLATFIPLENSWHMAECPGKGDLQYFLLHGQGAAIRALPTGGFEEKLKITVYDNGTVVFEELQKSYEGIHLCVRQQGEEIHGHQMPLKVRPLPPADLWREVYESMFLTGLISSMVIAFIFALGCLVYKKQWHPKPEDEKPVVGYENPTMTNYYDEESGSTNM